MSKQLRIIIWVLVGSCVLNLIFALNAGQKRKVAVSRYDTLDARLAETDLRYKNAIQSYDDVQKELQETKKDLAGQMVYSNTLKEMLANEQKKYQDLQNELEKLKLKPALPPALKQQVKKIQAAPKTGSSNIKW